MFESMWYPFGRKEEPQPAPLPPSVTITAIRIPADGSPAHLLPLSTIGNPKPVEKPANKTTDYVVDKPADHFLYHIPDVRRYWETEGAWENRQLHRLDLVQDELVPQALCARQLNDLKTLLLSERPLDEQQLEELRQRYLVPEQSYALPRHFASCTGAYYVFFSGAKDELPRNPSIPSWLAWLDTNEDGGLDGYYGDVFLVKVAACECQENGWAVYEDISMPFLDLLVEGPGEFD